MISHKRTQRTQRNPFELFMVLAVAFLVSCAGTKPCEQNDYAKSLNQALEAKDYKTADEIMTKLNTDFPGGPFRDSFLLKWAAVKINLGQLENAKALLQELMTDYPESSEFEKARKMSMLLEERLATQQK